MNMYEPDLMPDLMKYLTHLTAKSAATKPVNQMSIKVELVASKTSFQNSLFVYISEVIR